MEFSVAKQTRRNFCEPPGVFCPTTILQETSVNLHGILGCTTILEEISVNLQGIFGWTTIEEGISLNENIVDTVKTGSKEFS